MTGPGRYREAGRLLTDTEEHPDAETASTASGAQHQGGPGQV